MDAAIMAKMGELLIPFGPRLPDSDLAFRGNHKAPSPLVDFFLPEQLVDALNQASAARRMEADQQDAVMSARSEMPRIREIQILSD